MPRVALLADVHGNLHALKAVLKEVAKADVIGIGWGGDLVGYGAHPAECVQLARNLYGQGVTGNHDFYTNQIAALGVDQLPPGWESNTVWAGVERAVKCLDQDQLDWLKGLPWIYHLKDAVLAHASLHDAAEWPYIQSQEEATPTLELLREKGLGIGFFGHTHRQEYFAAPADWGCPPVEEMEGHRLHLPEGSICAIMLGSVGQPRDEGDKRAAWAVWDSDTRIVEFRRTAYDADAAAAAILEAGLPPGSAARLLGRG